MARIAVIMASLLPFICCENTELKLIGHLNNFFSFDHNIFLLESSVDVSRFTSSTSQTPQTVIVFNNSTGNINETKSKTKISSKKTFTIAALGDSSLDKSLDFFNQLKKIQRAQINMKIGIFFQRCASADELRKLFEWCKENLMANIFAACYVNLEGNDGPTTKDTLNIFTFNPFGHLDVLNVTTSESYENYFPSLQSNFQQHRLRANYPFIYESDKEIWSVVLRLMNGSFVVDSTFYEEVDISLYFYTQVRGLRVYPIVLSTWEIIVPEALPYTDFLAYIRIITSDKFLRFSLITIGGVTIFLTVCRYMKDKRNSLLQSAADVLNLLMNDNGYIRYQNLSRAEVLIIGPLTFVGFVIVNGILSNLHSYVTRPVLQPQIKTLEDIYSSPFPIITNGGTWAAMLVGALMGRSKNQDWADKIIAKDTIKHEELDMFNTSVSFFDVDSVIDVRFRVQKRLGIKGYYNPKLQVSQHLMAYQINDKFLFFDRFNDIVHRIKSAGLIDLWRRQDHDGEVSEMLKSNLERLKQLQEVQEIEFPTFIVYGWIASSILFVLEIVWKKFVCSQIKRVPRLVRKNFGKICRYTHCWKVRTLKSISNFIQNRRVGV